MLRSVRALLVILLWSVVARAQTPSHLVAVLPLTDIGTNTLTPGEVKSLTESIHTKANQALAGLGYTVLSRDNTLKLLQDNGVDEQKVCDANCALDAARELKTAFYLASSIGKIEKTFILSINFSETRGGRVLSSLELRKLAVLDLLDALDAQAPRFFEHALAGSEEGTVHVAAATPAAPEKVRRTSDIELPATIDVVVKSTAGLVLSGAEMTVDGRIEGTAPCSLSVPPGEHVIEARQKMYQRKSTTLQLKSGDVKTVTFELKPDFGLLSVKSEPKGATVTIDGVRAGAAPIRNIQLRTGTHTVDVQSADYLSFSQTITVRPSDMIDLAPVLVADFRGLTIRSDPDGADVKLDGTIIGKTPVQLPRVKSGQHAVEIRGDRLAYETWRGTVQIVRDQVPEPITATLVRRETDVVFTTQPPGATVALDDEDMGRTSLKLKLLGGDYHLRLTLKGYVPVEQKIRVRPPDPLRINVALSHGGSGPGGRFTMKDLGLQYEKAPAQPEFLDANRHETYVDFNGGAAVGIGAALTVAGGAVGYIITSYAQSALPAYTGTAASSGETTASPWTSKASGIGAIVGAGVALVVDVIVSVVVFYRRPEQVRDIPDDDARLENQRRLTQHQQDVDEVKEHNAEVKARIQEANATIENVADDDAPEAASSE